ncbi:Bgt-951 [Blumeria graminis f. sp. tritici]|uniref:Bgt-951 n=2 Tax=Blumeria graminis f. sp. tritici TaxID=62690 RepID=A0A381L719_BLUGR|nr:NADH-ubiquinone oxidoreductase [Blumeria graminis f. sp. tritici 96224]VDB83631.1 Bgt-951 [Blumeria graminis f. sp. tritici]
MRRSLRKLSAAQPSRYLESGAPTGITGLLTHASPRATLMYTYASTLDALAQLPESSLYRQSTEAITKHRMSIVSAVEPAGLAEYVERVKKILAANPSNFDNYNGHTHHVEKAGKKFIVIKPKPERDELTEEWDGMMDESSSKAKAEAGGENLLRLIEEVIQVAEGELKLVDVMIKAKVYVLFLKFIASFTYK